MSLNKIKEPYADYTEHHNNTSHCFPLLPIKMVLKRKVQTLLPFNSYRTSKKILEEASEVLANGFAAGDVALIQFVQNLDGNTDVLDSTNACSFLTM